MAVYDIFQQLNTLVFWILALIDRIGANAYNTPQVRTVFYIFYKLAKLVLGGERK